MTQEEVNFELMMEAREEILKAEKKEAEKTLNVPITN